MSTQSPSKATAPAAPSSTTCPSPSAASATTPTRRAAYFDLDKTVLATSTTFAMGDPMRRSGLISATALARGIVTHLPYLLVGADEDKTAIMMEKIASMAAGMERARLQEVVAEALSTVIEPAVYAEALDLIEAHHRAGHDVVIVSASIEEMVQPVARLVGADRAVATRMEVDAQGRFTGRVAHSVMHATKVDALEADATAHGIDLASSWAYSDSISDVPMLAAVGHPVAVNPDRDLRKYAAQSGWMVRDFERPMKLRRRIPSPVPQSLALREDQAESVRAACGLLAVGALAAFVVARRR